MASQNSVVVSFIHPPGEVASLGGALRSLGYEILMELPCGRIYKDRGGTKAIFAVGEVAFDDCPFTALVIGESTDFHVTPGLYNMRVTIIRKLERYLSDLAGLEPGRFERTVGEGDPDLDPFKQIQLFAEVRRMIESDE